MKTLVLVSLMLLSCGGAPEGEASDLGKVNDLGGAPDMPQVQGLGGAPGGGNDPCQLADCNGPLNKRIEFSDPARLNVSQSQ